MKSKLFTIEKGLYLATGLPSLFTSLRYYEDLRKAHLPSDDFYHAFTLFMILLSIGLILTSIYIGIFITERSVNRNLEKIKNEQGEETRAVEPGNR